MRCIQSTDPPTTTHAETTPTHADNAQTLSAFEGRGGEAKADFVGGLELEEEEEEEEELEERGHGHRGARGGKHDHDHHSTHHHDAGKGKKRRQHQHASLGFESVGIEIRDGPLDWTMFEDWLYNQVSWGAE
jgi:hypothetical protein